MSRRKERRYDYLLPTGNIKKMTESKINEINQKLLEGPKYKKYGLLYKNAEYGLMYKDFFEESKKFYKNGDVIDAFVILHGLIHATMEVAWNDFRLSITGTENFVPAEKDWDYKNLVELFHQLGIINNSKKKTLLDFNNGRNHAVHHLSHPTKRHLVTRKELGIKFRQGIRAHDIARTVRFDCLMKAYNSANKKSRKKNKACMKKKKKKGV